MQLSNDARMLPSWCVVMSQQALQFIHSYTSSHQQTFRTAEFFFVKSQADMWRSGAMAFWKWCLMYRALLPNEQWNRDSNTHKHTHTHIHTHTHTHTHTHLPAGPLSSPCRKTIVHASAAPTIGSIAWLCVPFLLHICAINLVNLS